MPHRLLGRLHATLLRPVSGQGTVEYVALILLVAVVLAGVVAATKSQHFTGTKIAETIVQKLKDAMQSVKP